MAKSGHRISYIRTTIRREIQNRPIVGVEFTMRINQDGQIGGFTRSRIGNLILNLMISAKGCVSRSVFDGLKVGRSEGKDVRSLIESDKIRGLSDVIIELIQDRTFFGGEGKLFL